MDDLDIKKGKDFILHAQFEDGELRFGLRSLAGPKGDFGIYPDMWLTAEEWDSLARRVEFQRADEGMGKWDIKKGETWVLHAEFQDGELRFGLRSVARTKGDFGIYDDMWLTAKEWDRLVKWVEFQRADERIWKHGATP